jgi:hypothetical protein
MDKQHLMILNQLFDMEKKVSGNEAMGKLQRNIDRIKGYYEEMGLTYANPMGEKFNETRTDCEASIVGEQTDNLVITEVIKPIIYIKEHGQPYITQKGVVIVEGR